MNDNDTTKCTCTCMWCEQGNHEKCGLDCPLAPPIAPEDPASANICIGCE